MNQRLIMMMLLGAVVFALLCAIVASTKSNVQKFAFEARKEKSSTNSKTINRKTSKTDNKINNIQRKNKLLPQLLPHADNRYILEFISDDNEQCDAMKPVVDRLEKDFNIKVRRLNISRRPDLLPLFEAVGGNEGGNLPFYYNRRTAQAICGATPYSNLKRLVMGATNHLFIDAPQVLSEKKSDYDPTKRRGVGVMDYAIGKFFAGQKKSAEKREKVEK